MILPSFLGHRALQGQAFQSVLIPVSLAAMLRAGQRDLKIMAFVVTGPGALDCSQGLDAFHFSSQTLVHVFCTVKTIHGLLTK